MPASNNTKVRQDPNVAAIAAEGQLKRSGSGRREAMFPMLYPNSVRQYDPFSYAYSWSIQEKTT